MKYFSPPPFVPWNVTMVNLTYLPVAIPPTGMKSLMGMSSQATPSMLSRLEETASVQTDLSWDTSILKSFVPLDGRKKGVSYRIICSESLRSSPVLCVGVEIVVNVLGLELADDDAATKVKDKVCVCHTDRRHPIVGLESSQNLAAVRKDLPRSVVIVGTYSIVCGIHNDVARTVGL